jgi:hypothetical protein
MPVDDHSRNEGITEELQAIDVSLRIKDYHINWLQTSGKDEAKYIS